CGERALALDDADYQAHVALAWTYLYRKDYDRLQKHVERAIRINPNDADTLANATYLLAMVGETDEAVKCGETAVRLPRLVSRLPLDRPLQRATLSPGPRSTFAVSGLLHRFSVLRSGDPCPYGAPRRSAALGR